MKDSSQPPKRRRYDAAFRAEALRLAEQSRSTQAAARALNINAKLLYKWQKEALTPVAAARGAELDPATATELRQLRALNRRQAQELDILKKAIAIFSVTDNVRAVQEKPTLALVGGRCRKGASGGLRLRAAHPRHVSTLAGGAGTGWLGSREVVYRCVGGV
jgi:transposase